MSTGQHSLVFLTTLEAGLAPTHRLDPPLWGGHGKEKALPRLRKRTTAVGGSAAMLDYVFRIVRVVEGSNYVSECTQYTAETRLSYCRHLRTVREHLMYLVNTREIVGEEETMAVDEEFWKRCRDEKTIWPYLLKVCRWDEESEPKLAEFTRKYSEDGENWRVLESEVRRLDEEEFNADEDALLRQFSANLHRIEKDVERCDRNLIFFSNKENLEALRRAMVTYVWRNLEDGYIQGMCDIMAPLLVVFEDEALTVECFTMIMTRLRDNFPHRTGMDICLMNFRSLIQVVDPQVFALLTSTSDATHLYFSYRWFLLDFKRELSYDSIFRVWETIWAAARTFTPHFPLFFGLAMVTNYREVIVANKMDFTDMIKFFNEMSERHDCSRLLTAARTHVRRLQNLVQHLR
uniref:Rab-GAP TBC domain-containing protein n=1 Tax=Angiostrongylus cantonensis TaxID=6313 RepID=A0A158P9H1_ANGCA